MNMQLVVISGPDRGRAFPLTDGQTLAIGRGQASGTQLRDARVSRIHCHVEVESGTVSLLHSGGSGGTLVNGKPIDRQELQPGDVIRIGKHLDRSTASVAGLLQRELKKLRRQLQEAD
jgi:pSer/pThr/pTyr-binding forkhead associated (FHA) protein